MADLITSCYSGRNKKCAEIFAKTGESWEKIEKVSSSSSRSCYDTRSPVLTFRSTRLQNHLNGQLLQGTLTTKEVHNFLVSRKRTYAYPLFEAVYAISFEGRPVKTIIDI
jgi:glycerol-3-phosphate dehydrogenase (NAD+)